MTRGDAPAARRGPSSLALLEGERFVCRLDPGRPLPAPPRSHRLWSLTLAHGERSLFAVAAAIPEGGSRNGPWRALRVGGPLPLGLTGGLAAAGVPIFVVATHDTDHVMVPAPVDGAAVAALRAAEHPVTGAAPGCPGPGAAQSSSKTVL